MNICKNSTEYSLNMNNNNYNINQPMMGQKNSNDITITEQPVSDQKNSNDITITEQPVSDQKNSNDITITEHDLLIEKIVNFINKQEAAPIQKSAEWYKIKKNTIGGSEVATVLGLNPFKTLKALVGEKTGVLNNKFNGNLYTRWGNIFENVTKSWAEKILLMDADIYESGSLEGILERQRYSPDGLGVVKLRDKYFIVLFEFKAPFKSIPDGKIPKYYRPQIQTGMLSIPIVDTSIFINNCYRKCKLKDIGFSYTYNQEFHINDKIKTKYVYACGVIYFYQTEKQYKKLTEDEKKYINEQDTVNRDDDKQEINDFINNGYSTSVCYNATNDYDILIKTREELLDFGDDNKYISRLFELHEEKKVFCEYSPLIINNNDIKNISFLAENNKLEREALKNTPKKIIKEFHDHFMNNCEKEKLIPIGYLPWKLVKSDIIQDNRIDNWYEQIAGPITQTIGNMDIISKSDNPEKKYYELYPKKKIIYNIEQDTPQETNQDTPQETNQDTPQETNQDTPQYNIELNINDMINCIMNDTV
jgi:hypothetical protein